eukprot:g19748.t1
MSSATPADTAQHSYSRVAARQVYLLIDSFMLVSQVVSVRSTNVKLMFFSDHCFLLANYHLQDDQWVGKGTWNFNVKLLTPKHTEGLRSTLVFRGGDGADRITLENLQILLLLQTM